MSRIHVDALSAFNSIAEEDIGWREADRKTRVLLEKYTAEGQIPAFVLEQYAADAMLRTALVKGENTEDKQKALARYTAMMTENRSGQALVVLPALERLRGHWSEERIRKAAASTARRAFAKMDKMKTCKGCSAAKQKAHQMAKKGRPPLLKKSIQRFYGRMEAAAGKLEAMGETQ